MKMTFVNGFLKSISVTLQRFPHVKTQKISELISTANVITAKRTLEVAVALELGICKEPR